MMNVPKPFQIRRRRPLVRAIVLLAAIGTASIALVSIARAKPGTVTTSSGQSMTGDVHELTGIVVIEVKGVMTTINRADVTSITYDHTFDDLFKAENDKLDPDDLKGHLALAKKAIDNNRLDLAVDAVKQAEKVNATDSQVASLKDVIRKQMRMERDRVARAATQPALSTQPSPAAPADAAASGASDNEHAVGSLGPIERRYLSMEDIQVIRQNELKSGDTAHVQIPNDVRRDFAAKSGLDFADFNAKPQVDQALAIFASEDASMKKMVKVVTDPAAMIEFKQLQPRILAGCASVACHGGKDGGNLVLFSPADSDAATYTNFYILSKYSKTVNQAGTGMFAGPTEKKMIDRGRGEQSLLVQFGLPPFKAATRHPKVAGMKELFRDVSEPQAKKMIDWMNRTMNPTPPDPDFKDIKYKIIKFPTSQPSTAPSKNP